MKSYSLLVTLEKMGYLTREQVNEFEGKSMREFILDFILPRVVEVGGQDTRGWRLSPSFMKLMNEHSQDFIREDRELGEMLFELALQRIQRHPELKSIDYRGILPAEYQKYSAAWDQVGLWGEAEWAFMEETLREGLQLSNEAYRTHCRELIMEILSVVHPKDSDSWFGMRTEVPAGKLYRWAVTRALLSAEPAEVAEELLRRAQGNWRSNKAFYAQFASKLDWEKFFSRVDLKKEQYYRGFKRGVLKLFGCYNKATKKRICEEIRKTSWA